MSEFSFGHSAVDPSCEVRRDLLVVPGVFLRRSAFCLYILFEMGINL